MVLAPEVIDELTNRGDETLSPSVRFFPHGWEDKWTLERWEKITGKNPEYINILDYCVQEGLLDSEKAYEFFNNEYLYLENFLELLVADPNVYQNFKLLVHFEVITYENFDRDFLRQAFGETEIGHFLKVSPERRTKLHKLGLFTGNLLQERDIIFHLALSNETELTRYSQIGLFNIEPRPYSGHIRELMFSDDEKLEILKEIQIVEGEEDQNSPIGWRITALTDRLTQEQLSYLLGMRKKSLRYAIDYGLILIPAETTPDLENRLKLMYAMRPEVLYACTEEGWVSADNMFRLAAENRFFTEMIKLKHPRSFVQSLKAYSEAHEDCNPLEAEHIDGFIQWYLTLALEQYAPVDNKERGENITVAHEAQAEALEKIERHKDGYLSPSEFLEEMAGRFRLVLYFRPELESFEGQYIAALAQQYIQSGRSKLFTDLVITSRNVNDYPKTIHSLGIHENQYQFYSGNQFQDICHVGSVPVHFSHGQPQNAKYEAVAIVVDDIMRDKEKMGNPECDPERLVHLPLGYETEKYKGRESGLITKFDQDGDYDRMQKISTAFLTALREAEDKILALAA